MVLSHHVRPLLLGHIQYIHAIIQVVRLMAVGSQFFVLSVVSVVKSLATIICKLWHNAKIKVICFYVHSGLISTVGDLCRWPLSAAGVYVTRLSIQVCPTLWRFLNLSLLRLLSSTFFTLPPLKLTYTSPRISNSIRGTIEG